ncbi:hypothetical protein ACWD5R_02020 [Streptomyces sp. NPDC002514]|uniref:hypothetical protein n=1 Tax=unclassified Streptomyces TaxID=2593676 RepID=UPI003688E1F0
MGERHSDGGRSGRRRAHRAGVAPVWGQAGPEAVLAERIGTVVRSDGAGVDPEAERRAVAAFRAARGTQAHRARTRRRDDWRLSRPRRVRLSARASLSAVLASIALGGLAVAAIASAGSPAHEDRRPAAPSARPADGGGTTHSGDRPPAKPSTGPAATGPAPAPSAAPDHGHRDRPATAADLLAHCRAYEQVKGRGKALDSTAWQRLVTAAGGAEKVPAYCARQLATATATAAAARTEEPQTAAPRTAAPQAQEPQADEKQPEEKQTEVTQAPEQMQTEGTPAPEEKRPKEKK